MEVFLFRNSEVIWTFCFSLEHKGVFIHFSSLAYMFYSTVYSLDVLKWKFHSIRVVVTESKSNGENNNICNLILKNKPFPLGQQLPPLLSIMVV